jgi:indolepyruvate ferredoxin oxidoreductase beta subunit
MRQLFAQASNHVYFIPAMQIAEAIGNARTNNVVLLGALSALLAVPSEEKWLEVIAERVPPKYIEVNRQAFLRGREVVK